MIKQMFFIVAIFTVLSFNSCTLDADDELVDKKETVTLYISSDTGSATGFNGDTYECMLVREEGQSSWERWPFEGISGFTYEKGFEYKLLVTKTIYANPPADGGTYGYELISIVSKVLPEDSGN